MKPRAVRVGSSVRPARLPLPRLLPLHRRVLLARLLLHRVLLLGAWALALGGAPPGGVPAAWAAGVGEAPAAASPPRVLLSELKPVADPRAILQDLQQKMASLGSVELEFIQERHLKIFAEPLHSEGVMLMEPPDQIRWETTAPYQSILLGNHASVAQFERTEKDWQKLRLGFPQMLKRVMEQMVRMHQGKIDALTSDFTLSVSTGRVAVVTLVPKDGTIRSMLSSLEVHLAPDFSATREVVMNEPSGELTRILFRKERRNVVFPPGTFDQAKPLDLAAVRTGRKDP